MNILIMGVDGYIGWPLALRELKKGNKVAGIDSFFTRKRVKEVHSDSVLPVPPFGERNARLQKKYGKGIKFYRGDVSDAKFLFDVIRKEKPDAIVHLAEQRSAPYSMIGLKQATETMVKNIVSTLNLAYAVKETVPEAHILKLGTMGEYGTPNIDIPEGFFEVEYHGRKDFLPFPKQAGSWYHWTKVHDSNNLMFANKLWKTPITDVMQGVVYGTRTKEIEETGLFTRFDIDEVWGTALNRFCAQATVGLPLTPYGRGGQTRGFLSLEDSITCLDLALHNPPQNGEYRVFNQFDEHYSVLQLAKMVRFIYERLYGGRVEIVNTPNPRVEMEEHYYNPEHTKLAKLGYRRSRSLEDEIKIILEDLARFKGKIESLRNVINPKTIWVKSSSQILS
ncbi:MAG TPA: UDP-sulfoquinovose synthase [Thermoplasmataceae archaeon]|nr:NAD-dependent epimerase/dehydratase family protein [Thermoplasmatales archaeon AK]HLH85509.1 UDP-sulfoquinovose synthase [Thermoplasmataceae archaeon]